MTRVRRMVEDDDDAFYDDRPVRRRGGYGLIGGVIDSALRNPVIAAGTVISGLAIIIIVTNALSNQPMHHPSPLFNTRQSAAAAAPVAALPPVPAPVANALPPVPAEATQVPPQPQQALAVNQTATLQPVAQTVASVVGSSAAVSPAAAPLASEAVAPPLQPAVHPLTPAAATLSPAPLAPTGPSPQLITHIQHELHDRGFYSGAIDGLSGPATAEAIRSFEQRMGVAAKGEPNDHVLALLRSSRARGIVAHPASPVVAARPAPVVATVQHAAMQPMPAPIPPEPLTGSIEGKTQRVQRGLNIAGYGMVRTDGRIDEATVNAIKTFETEHGMPVTGRISDRLVSALSPRSASAE